jgi:hypothetical protein
MEKISRPVFIDSDGEFTGRTANVEARSICNHECQFPDLAMVYSEDAKGGIATFKNIKIEGKVGDTFTLTFESGDIKSTGLGITIENAGEAYQLVLKTQDDNVLSDSLKLTNGKSLSELKVEIQDSSGNTVTDSNATVEIGIDGNATLSCQDPCKNNDGRATVTANEGVASLSELKIQGNPGNYKLTFSAAGLDSIDKAIQLKAGVAVKLGIIQGSINGLDGRSVVIASGEKASALEIKVKAKDINGNIVENSNAIVKIGIDNDGRLSCESPCEIKDNKATIELINGIGNFNNLSIEGKEDKTYSLTIITESGISTTSFFNSFKIIRAGPASKLIILNDDVEIKDDVLNLGKFEPPHQFTDLKVKVTDNYGNPVTSGTVIFKITKGDGDLSDITSDINKEGIAILKKWYWEEGDQSVEHQLTASLKNNKVTYIAELYYPASKIVIKEIPTNHQKFKINLGDFIRKNIMDYRKKGEYELLSVSGEVQYTEKIDNAVTPEYNRSTNELKLNINKEVDTNNEIFSKELQKNITSREVDLGKDFELKFDLFDCEKEEPTIGNYTKSQGGDPAYWTEIKKGENSGSSKKDVGTYHISIYGDDYSKYQIPEGYRYKIATRTIKPIYYGCDPKEDTESFKFKAPSMAIESGGTLGAIKVQLTGYDNKAVSDANDKVTVSLNAKTDNKLLCITDEDGSNHCNNEVLNCINNDKGCLTVIADKGIATFNDLVLKGKVGKIYSLQFTSGNLTPTDNNHTSQVYIHSAGGVSETQSKIVVEDNKSITADGTSTAIITVQLNDASGNPITGKEVTLKTDIGTFENNEQSIVVKDKGDGSYTATLTSTNARTANITATVDHQEIEGKASVTFKAGEPHKIEFIDENINIAETATVGTEVTGIPLSFKVTDKNNNPVEEIDVIFKVVSGGGNLQSKSSAEWPSTEEKVITNNEGIATLNDIEWFLGDQARLNELHVTFDGATLDQSIAFKVEGTPDKAEHIHEYTDDKYEYDETGTVGNSLKNPPKILITDLHRNPVYSKIISYTVYDVEGNTSIKSATSNDEGIATLGDWILDTTAGDNRIVAKMQSISGILKKIEFRVTGEADRSSLFIAPAIPDNENLTATVGTKVETPPSVKVTDIHQNPIDNIPVTFEIITQWDGYNGSITSEDKPYLKSWGDYLLDTTKGKLRRTILTNKNGIATIPGWSLGLNASRKYQLKAYINEAPQSSITFSATTLVSLNESGRISVSKNGGIAIEKDLDASYQANLSHIKVDEIYSNIGNIIYEKDKVNFENLTGEIKIKVSVNDDTSGYKFECELQKSNECEVDDNTVILTFKEDVSHKEFNFKDVLFTGEYNKDYKIQFQILGSYVKHTYEYNHPSLTINAPKNELALSKQEINVRNGDLFKDPPRIEVKDPKDEVLNINQTAKLIIQIIEGEGGKLSCDGNEKTQCIEKGQTITVYPSDGIFTLETMVLHGKKDETYTLKLTSKNQNLISTTLKVKITEAGEPAKLSIKQQPSETVVNGVALEDQPIVQLLDKNDNLVIKANNQIKVKIIGVTDCFLVETECTYPAFTNEKISTNENGNAIHNSKIGGKKGRYQLEFSLIDSDIPPVKSDFFELLAGPATQLELIQPPSTSTTNGEPLAQQPIIQLKDFVGNDVKSDGVTITAQLNYDARFAQQYYCTNFNFGCTTTTLKGTKNKQTDMNGQAKFTDLSLSGQLNTKYELIFTATGLIPEKPENITIDKPGKPKQIKIYQDQIEKGFASESTLNHVQVQIQDSGGNEVESSLSAGAKLDIELTEGTNAELGCVGSENHGCVTYGNGKKITIPIDQPTTTLDTVILAGKIGEHKLKVSMNEFEKELKVNIKNSGAAAKITILDSDNCLDNPLSGNPTSDKYCYLGEFKQNKDKKELRLQVLDMFDNPSAGQIVKFDDKARRAANGEAISDKDGIVIVDVRNTQEHVYEIYKYMWGLQPDGTSWIVNPKLSAYINNQQADNERSRVTLEIATPLILKLEWPYKNSVNFSGLYNLKDGLEFHKQPENGNVKFNEDQKNIYSLLESKIDQAIYHINNNGENKVFDKFIYKYNVPDEFKDKLGNTLYPTVYIYLKNDPEYQNQWYLHSSKDGGINLDSAILLGHQRESNENGYTGDGIKIGIFGDEIYKDHKDIDEIQNLGEEAKIIHEEPTNVAGLIAATGWNSLGIRGVAPNSSLMSFSMLDNPNYVPSNKDNNQILLKYNTKKIPLESINIYHLTESWASAFNSGTSIPPDSQIWEKIWEKIWFKQAMIRGTGNNFKSLENSNPSCKAKNKSCQMPINDSIVYHPAIVNVAALTKERKRASYSIYNSSNWISAPGGEDGGVYQDIITTCHDRSEWCQSGYKNFANTSVSAAIVTGVIALMLEANPELDWRDIKYILAKTAVQIDKDDNGWIANKAGYKFHNAYGFGAIDAKAAVQMAIDFTTDLGAFEKNDPEFKQGKETVFCTFKNEQETEIKFTQDIYLEYVQLKLERGPSDCVHESTKNITSFVQNTIDLVSGEHYIEVTLKSPSNKTVFSQTLDGNSLSYMDQDSQPIIMIPNQFFGEKSAGNWKLTIKDNSMKSPYGVKASLLLHGTKTDISKTTNP